MTVPLFEAYTKVSECCANIQERVHHWIDIKDNGCHDPFWADGVNMNLTRNHIIYYRKQILEICDSMFIPLPAEMDIPVPPVVPQNFMADLSCERAVNLQENWHETLVHCDIDYDPFPNGGL